MWTLPSFVVIMVRERYLDKGWEGFLMMKEKVTKNVAWIIGCFLFLVNSPAVADLGENTPEAMGYDSVKLNKVKELLDPLYDSGRIPNYILVLAKGGEIFFSLTRGNKEIGTADPVDLDTVYQLASMTKPLTTSIAFMLIEEGKLSFEDELIEFYPQFENLLVAPGGSFETEFEELERNITILDLLTHTSGFSYGEQVIGKGDVAKQYDDLGIFTGEGSDRSAHENAEILAEVPLIAQPGTQFNYSIGIDLLGGVIELIEGKKLGEVMKERLFDPLGMNNAGFKQPDRPGSYARLYGLPGVGQSPLGRVKGSEIVWRINLATALRSPKPKMDSGGGGMWASANDYLKYLTMLTANGAYDGLRVMKGETVSLHFQNLTPKLPFRPINANFGEAASLVEFAGGFGLRKESSEGRSVDYFFWGGAYNTGFWIDPNDNSVGVFLTQHAPGRYNLTDQLEDLVDQARL